MGNPNKSQWLLVKSPWEITIKVAPAHHAHSSSAHVGDERRPHLPSAAPSGAILLRPPSFALPGPPGHP